MFEDFLARQARVEGTQKRCKTTGFEKGVARNNLKQMVLRRF